MGGLDCPFGEKYCTYRIHVEPSAVVHVPRTSGMPSVSQHATNISTPDAAYAVLTKAKPSTLYYRLMPHPVMVSSFSGGEVQGENVNLERASGFFLGKKAPLLDATLGKIRPKKAPLRIRSSQKRPFSYMHFPAKKTI